MSRRPSSAPVTDARRTPESFGDVRDGVAVQRRRAGAYATALLAAALGVTLALMLAGAELPPLGACFVLAVPLAICMNRYVFFPNEAGVTGEAAVLFAAVVALRDHGGLLGPLLIALLVGVLDARHWEHRAFARMAYNSGSQALTVFVATLTFRLVEEKTGASGVGLTLAATVAAVPYVLAETTFGVVLMRLLGDRVGRALRQQVPVNALAFPLAVFGTAVGAGAADASWWLKGLLLAPTAFVPELVLVTLRRSSRPPRIVRTSAALAVVAAIGGAAWWVGGPDAAAAGALLTTLVLALGGDARAGARAGVPISAALAVVCTVVVIPGGWSLVACAAAAVLATAAAAVMSGIGEPWIPRIAGAGGAALLGAASALLAGTVLDAPILLAAIAGLVFLLATTGRRVSGAAPLVIVSASLVVVVPSEMFREAAVMTAGMVAILACVSIWGPMPWSSRVIGPWGARHSLTCAMPVLGAAASTTTIATVWSIWSGSPGSAALATAAGMLVVACAAAAVRQWRFARRRRLRDFGVLVGAATLLLGAAPPASTTAWTVAANLVAVIAAASVAYGCARALHRALAPDRHA